MNLLEDDLPTVCACGYDLYEIETYHDLHFGSGAALRHRYQHDRWVNGVPISTAAGRGGLVPPVTVIDSTCPTPVSRVASNLARQFQRTMRYDFPAWSMHWERDSNRVVASIAVEDHRAVGIMCVLPCTDRFLWPGVGGLDTREAQRAGPGWMITCVWVIPSQRRRGHGRRMLRAAAERLGVSAAEIAGNWPVSDDGLALLRNAAGQAHIWIA